MRLRTLASRERTTIIPVAPSSSSGESSYHGVSSYGASTSDPEQESSMEIGMSEAEQESPLQIGTSQPRQENPLQIGTSQPREDNPLQGSTQQKKRGKTLCNKTWSIADPDKRFRLELNKYNQPIGETAAKLSSSCGVVARMSTLCPITYNDWRILLKDMREHIISYMKERFILADEIEEACALKSIGHSWSTHKTKLRKSIYKAHEEGQSKPEIHGNVPYGVEAPQWIQFVDYWLTDEAIEISNKHKAIREKQKQMHTTGSKSYARKRKEMEDARDREIGAVEFYRETHMKKNGQMDDDAWDVWDKCNVLLSDKVPAQDHGDSFCSADRIHLEEEVMLEVLGAEHPGRVRGAGRGPTPAIWFDRKSTSDEARILEAKIESLTKRNAELDHHKAELEKREAEREVEFNRLKQMLEVQTLRAEVESLTKRNAELEQREVEREKREAEREVEFNRLKQMLEDFMRR